jgi:hypothetical protein
MQLNPLATLSTILILLTGCSSSSDHANPLTPVESAEPPTIWQFAGTQWTRTETATDSDWAVLQKFFEQQPRYAESAEFTGNPILYRNSGNQRLYLWINPAVDGSSWQLVRQQGQQFHRESGTGTPWQS